MAAAACSWLPPERAPSSFPRAEAHGCPDGRRRRVRALPGDGCVSGWGGTGGLTLQKAAFDTTSGISEVGAGAGSPFVVTHKFSIAQETANLFQVDVTITNNTSSLGELLGLHEYGPLTPTYRRVMDWDVEPTAFSEYVTIGAKGGQPPPEVVTATNDGFAGPDPRDAATDLGARGLFEDFGPTDHGALFDVRLPEIDPGESVTFTMFYGAGATEAMAKDALRLVKRGCLKPGRARRG